jgi:SAM-dependent methyltransferase
MIDIREISPVLSLEPNGIWSCTNGTPEARLDWPEGGHEACLQVEDSSFWFRHRNECLLQTLKQYPPAGPLLEIGGGNGFVCHGLEQANLPTMLLEPVLAGAMNARARGLPSVICCTLESARFKDNSVAAAGIFDVLEHVQDDERFLQEICRVLIPGGRVYITVPAYSWLWSDVDVHAGHHRRYTLAGLNADLSKAGFATEYVTYFFAPLVLPIYLLRTIPSKFNKTSGKELPPEMAEAAADQHSSQGLLGSAMEKLLQKERDWLNQGKRLCFGSSCLAVARKI